jgi:ubiquitin conjugation factor E4 B
VLCTAAFGEVPSGSTRIPPPLSPAYTVLPTLLLEDVFEALQTYEMLASSGLSGSKTNELLALLDPAVFLPMLLLTLASDDHAKNPNIRGRAARLVKTLMKSNAYSRKITEDSMCVQNLIPSLICVFVVVEKTKQSYYDIRFQLKYEMRVPVLELFEALLPQSAHRARLIEFAKEKTDTFAKFMNLLLNDATFMLDEGMDSLVEVRKRAGNEVAAEQEGTAGLGQERGVDEEDRTADGRDIYEQSRHDPVEHCKKYMELANRSISTLSRVAEEAIDVLVTEQVILTQLVQNFLDPLLDRLVGPKCLALKAKDGANDFAQFNFDPRDLLRKVGTMYVRAAAINQAKVFRLIAEDPLYKPDTFRKAQRILDREQLAAAADREAFGAFVRDLNSSACAREEEEIDWPDELLDPLMAEVMRDPVELPSGNVLDRQVAMRIIMSGDYDPFTKVPMKAEDLKPRPDIRAKLDAFCAEKGISLDE